MEESLFNMKIGCYCPYTYAILKQFSNVEIVLFNWNNQSLMTVGSLQLCRKMSCVYSSLNNIQLDGFFMVDCCCFSNVMYEFIKKEFTNLAVANLVLPRKHNEVTYQYYIKEYERIHKLWNLVKLSERFKIQRNDMAAYNIQNYWCKIHDNAEGNDLLEGAEAFEYLLEHTVCYRELNNKTVNIINNYAAFDWEEYRNNKDDRCPSQIYFDSVMRQKGYSYETT